MGTDASAIVTPEEYLRDRGHIFGSAESLRWFIRRNRAELLKRRAIIAPAGRKLLVAPVFDQAVVDIGAAKAERMSEAWA